MSANGVVPAAGGVHVARAAAAHVLVIATWVWLIIIVTKKLHHQMETMDRMLVMVTFICMIVQSLITYYILEPVRYQPVSLCDEEGDWHGEEPGKFPEGGSGPGPKPHNTTTAAAHPPAAANVL